MARVCDPLDPAVSNAWIDNPAGLEYGAFCVKPTTSAKGP
jgi:hypothetical protein